MIAVSVIVLTQDEEANIEPCLSALERFEDVVVVDSGSTDRTLDLIAERFSRVRVFSHPFEDFGAQRNWALEATELRHDWVLFVDADEFMEEGLADEINSVVRDPGEAVGAYIAGRNYFLGRWLKRSTYFPSYQLRLLKRGEVTFRKEGHGQREVAEGPLTYLKQSWRHEGFSKGLHQWIARHNEYSSNEVELLVRLRGEKLNWGDLFSRDPITRRRALKVLGAKLPLRPWTRFCYTYFFRLGLLDGRRGLQFCLLRFAHDIHIVSKLAEHRYRTA